MSNWKRTAYISSPARTRLPHRRGKSHFWANAKKFFRNNKTALLVLLIIILVVMIWRFTYNSTLGKPANIIHEIVFTDEDLQVYDNKELYTFIREQLVGRNVVSLKLKNGGSAKDIITNAYPFITDISLDKIADSKISVWLDFAPADLVFTNEAFSIGYANKSLFLVNDNNTIISGAIRIQLPAYFSGDVIQSDPKTYISLLWPEKFKIEFNLIWSRINMDNILLLAGTQKSLIISWNKRITFDHKRSIEAQLEYLSTIKGLDASFFYEIDLTVYPKAIIRKVESFQ